MERKQNGYSINQKLEGVELVARVGLPAAVSQLGYPYSTVHGWWHERDKLRVYTGNKLAKTTKGQGRKESFPFTPALVTFMKDIRRDEDVWGLDQETKLPCTDLQRIKTEFALAFWDQYSAYTPSEIYNVDETAIQFDMPPTRIWGVKGRKGSAKIHDLTKHCGRMTAVLTIRADRKKLPILFILRGKPGGSIESNELDNLPRGHFYTVQEAVWMDAPGWAYYVENVLKYEIDSPALLLADNFNCHVSEEGVRLVTEEACATVVPLPPKSTSVCQPLDVVVMGPLKASIRGKLLPKRGLTASEKRLRVITATISAWEHFSTENVIRSFQTAIPRYESTTV